MSDRQRQWQALAFAALVIAALGGNWLLGRKSIGASTLQLVAAWVQIVGGATVAWWAWRRSRTQKEGPAV